MISTARLILKEIRHRKANFLLSLLGLSVTVAFFVAFQTMSVAANRETTRVTRDMGFNLRIIPKETDMEAFWIQGFSDLTMPEETVKRLAGYEQVFFSYNHLVATLQQRFEFKGSTFLLTGLSPAITAAAQKKQPMGYQIERGNLLVGFEAARRLGVKKGETLRIGEQDYKIERTLVESGTSEDIQIFGHLADAQEILGLKGRINEIKAIDCLCLTADEDPVSILRAELEKALPEARVIQMRAIADARAKQRQTVERYNHFITPLLTLVSAGWIGLLAVFNVRERKGEIGVMRALGKGSIQIACLFLGKAVVIGLAGAAVGYFGGTALAMKYGPEIFRVTAKAIQPEQGLLIWAAWAAPLFSAVASFVPAMLAVRLDPAVALREE